MVSLFARGFLIKALHDDMGGIVFVVPDELERSCVIVAV